MIRAVYSLFIELPRAYFAYRRALAFAKVHRAGDLISMIGRMMGEGAMPKFDDFSWAENRIFRYLSAARYLRGDEDIDFSGFQVPVRPERQDPRLNEHFKLLGDLARARPEDREQIALQLIAISGATAAAFKEYSPESPLPGHAGFERAIIECSKRGDFEGAIALVRRAQAEGWDHERHRTAWDERIEWLEARKARSQKRVVASRKTAPPTPTRR